jgi:hypothetical protein
VLLDCLDDAGRWPPGSPMGLVRKSAAAAQLDRFHTEPDAVVKAQAVRQLALLNNNRSRAHKVHDAHEEQPANYPADTPFTRLPLSRQQWSLSMSAMEIKAQVAARYDCDGYCGTLVSSCQINGHGPDPDHAPDRCCWRFQAQITLTKAPCVAEWIRDSLGLGTVHKGRFSVRSTAALGTFFEQVVEPFSVRKGQRFAFLWLVCMQQQSHRHNMPCGPPECALNDETMHSDWMDAARGCGIRVWECAS